MSEKENSGVEEGGGEVEGGREEEGSGEEEGGGAASFGGQANLEAELELIARVRLAGQQERGRGWWGGRWNMMEYMRTEYDGLHSRIEASETRINKELRDKAEEQARQDATMGGS